MVAIRFALLIIALSALAGWAARGSVEDLLKGSPAANGTEGGAERVRIARHDVASAVGNATSDSEAAAQDEAPQPAAGGADPEGVMAGCRRVGAGCGVHSQCCSGRCGGLGRCASHIR